ncbi:MAG: portal protein [Actinomycetota bacterium]
MEALEDAAYTDAEDLYPRTPEDHQRLLSWALDAFGAADRARERFAERWRRYNQLYRGYVPPRKAGAWRHRLFIAITFQIVETVLPKLVAQLPKMLVRPVGPEDEEPAKVMEDLLEWASYQSELYVQLVAAYKSALKYGTGILKTRLGKKTRTRTVQVPVMARQTESFEQVVLDPSTGAPLTDIDGNEMTETIEVEGPEAETGELRSERVTDVLYEGPVAESVDVLNFWPAPEAIDIQGARFLIHRVFVSDREFARKVKEGLYRLPEHMRSADLWSSETEPVLERRDDIGMGSGTDPTRRLVELLEYWTDETVMVVANRRAVVRVSANPYEHGEKPFVLLPDHFQENEFWGVGEIEPIEGTQDAINALWSQRLDNVRLALDRRWVVDVNRLWDQRDLENRPGQIVRVNSQEADPRTVLFPLETPDITSSAYTEAAELERMVEKTLAVSAYQTGADSPTLNKTATGVALISEQGNSRFALKVEMAELLGLSPLARHYGSILQQFLPDEIVVRREGPQGGYEWQQITSDSIQGAFDYEIEAGSSTVTESVRKEQAMTLMQVLTGLADPITGQPIVNVRALVEDLLTQFGKKDMERYLTPEQPPMLPAMAQMAPGLAPPLGLGPEPVGNGQAFA